MATANQPVKTVLSLSSSVYQELVNNLAQAKSMLKDLDGKSGVIEVNVKQGDSYIATSISVHEMRRSLQQTITNNTTKINKIEVIAQLLWSAAYD